MEVSKLQNEVKIQAQNDAKNVQNNTLINKENNLERTPSKDSVDVNNEKKTKYAIIAAALTLAAGVGIYALSRGKWRNKAPEEIKQKGAEIVQETKGKGRDTNTVVSEAKDTAINTVKEKASYLSRRVTPRRRKPLPPNQKNVHLAQNAHQTAENSAPLYTYAPAKSEIAKPKGPLHPEAWSATDTHSRKIKANAINADEKLKIVNNRKEQLAKEQARIQAQKAQKEAEALAKSQEQIAFQTKQIKEKLKTQDSDVITLVEDGTKDESLWGKLSVYHVTPEKGMTKVVEVDKHGTVREVAMFDSNTKITDIHKTKAGESKQTRYRKSSNPKDNGWLKHSRDNVIEGQGVIRKLYNKEGKIDRVITVDDATISFERYKDGFSRYTEIYDKKTRKLINVIPSRKSYASTYKPGDEADLSKKAAKILQLEGGGYLYEMPNGAIVTPEDYHFPGGEGGYRRLMNYIESFEPQRPKYQTASQTQRQRVFA